LQYGAIEKVRAKYANLIWNCHLTSLQDTGKDLPLVLWRFSAEFFADRTQILLHKAGETGQANLDDQLARQNAEDGISLLTSQDPATLEKLTEEYRRGIRKIKAKVSFRAARACQGLGDRDAAV